MSDDPASDKYFEDGGNGTYGPNDQFNMHTNGPTSCFITRDPGFVETDLGCNEDFADNEARGFAYKSTDIRDIEMKMLVSIDGGGHGFSVSGPTGRHKSNSSPCCGGNAYMVSFEYDQNPTQFRFRKEMWHVSYHDDPVTGGLFTHPLCNFAINGHGFVGIGYVRYNKPDGVSAGKDSVVIELWFNPDPDSDITAWTMLKRTEDKGGWGNDGDQCGGDKDQILSWGGVKFRMKSNDPNADIIIKHLSLREINPFGTFDDDPGNPEEPPQQVETLQGSFKVQWDVNQLRVSPCAGSGSGGGGGSGNTVFYTVATGSDKELSDSSTFQNRKRIVMSPANSSSVFTGKIPIQFDIPLKKVGTPGASPTVGAKIWNSGGTVVYTSPTTFDPSTFTTSYVTKTFDFSTNTHALVTGDRIGVEYTGTSNSNYVMASYQGSSTANTNYYQYEGTTWQSKSRSLSCTVWQ